MLCPPPAVRKTFSCTDLLRPGLRISWTLKASFGVNGTPWMLSGFVAGAESWQS